MGIYIDCHLNWKYHVDELSTKLSRANGMLAKIRHYVSYLTLTMIYHGIFSSLLLYGSQIWGQANQPVLTLRRIQNKALRIINFEHHRTSANILYHNSKILKLGDSIKLSNFLYAHDIFTNNIPSVFCNILHLTENSHLFNTRNIKYKSFIIPTVRTTIFGLNSIKSKSVGIWNSYNRTFYILKLFDKKRNYCKCFIKNDLIKDYL